MPVPLLRCLQDRFSPFSSSWPIPLGLAAEPCVSPCAASRSYVRGVTHALCSSGQTSSPMNLGPPKPGEPSQVSASKRHRQGSGGIRQRRQKKPSEECCCGRGRSCGRRGWGVLQMIPLCCKSLAGARHLAKLCSQRTALFEVPGSARQFRVVPSKRCSLLQMGVGNLLPRQVEQFLS